MIDDQNHLVQDTISEGTQQAALDETGKAHVAKALADLHLTNGDAEQAPQQAPPPQAEIATAHLNGHAKSAGAGTGTRNGHSTAAEADLLAQERMATFEAVPAELRALRQWVVYKVRPKRDKQGRIVKGKLDKIPFNARTGMNADVSDSDTFSSFDDAVSAYEASDGKYPGIGFVFTTGDPYCGIDFDECRDKEHGALLAWAAEFLAEFATYAEVSPSESGIHLIGRAVGGVGVGNRKDYQGGRVEKYDRGRFFSVTGRRVAGTPATINDVTQALATLQAKVWGSDRSDNGAGADTGAGGSERQGADLDPRDRKLFGKIISSKGGEVFLALWSGQPTSADPNLSDDDASLVSRLAFWLNRDAARMDRWFRSSPRMRPKWDKIHHGGVETYGDHLIRMAITEWVKEGEGYTGEGDSFTAGAGTRTEGEGARARPLPAPMEADAYYGPLGEIAKGIKPFIEADSSALMVNLVVLAGVAMGRGPYIQVGAKRQYALLNTVTCGESGDNKSDGTNAPIDLIETAGAINVSDSFPDPVDFPRINGLSSGEGLLWQMRDAITKMVKTKTKDKKTGKTTEETTEEIVDAGVEDKRLLALEPEFARTLTTMAREGNTLSTIIRTLYDSPRKAQSTSKNSPCTASAPHFAMIGQVTPTELKSRMSEVDLVNGFTGRIIWTYSRRICSMPNPPDYSTVVHDHARIWIAAIERAVKIGEVTRDADAVAEWEVLYEQLRQGTLPGMPPREGMAKEVCSRSHTVVIRLSLILAALDGCAIITTAHQNAALSIWRYCERCANFLFGDLAADPISNVILTALRAGRKKREEITALFSRHVKAGAIDFALEQLRAAGQARSYQESSGGRPVTWWEYVEQEQSDAHA
jgi:hypothetical protein